MRPHERMSLPDTAESTLFTKSRKRSLIKNDLELSCIFEEVFFYNLSFFTPNKSHEFRVVAAISAGESWKPFWNTGHRFCAGRFHKASRWWTTKLPSAYNTNLVNQTTVMVKSNRPFNSWKSFSKRISSSVCVCVRALVSDDPRWRQKICHVLSLSLAHNSIYRRINAPTNHTNHGSYGTLELRHTCEKYVLHKDHPFQVAPQHTHSQSILFCERLVLSPSSNHYVSPKTVDS